MWRYMSSTTTTTKGLWQAEIFQNLFSNWKEVERKLATDGYVMEEILPTRYLNVLKKYLPETSLKALSPEYLKNPEIFASIAVVLKSQSPDAVTALSQYIPTMNMHNFVRFAFPNARIETVWYVDDSYRNGIIVYENGKKIVDETHIVDEADLEEVAEDENLAIDADDDDEIPF